MQAIERYNSLLSHLRYAQNSEKKETLVLTYTDPLDRTVLENFSKLAKALGWKTNVTTSRFRTDNPPNQFTYAVVISKDNLIKALGLTKDNLPEEDPQALERWSSSGLLPKKRRSVIFDQYNEIKDYLYYVEHSDISISLVYRYEHQGDSDHKTLFQKFVSNLNHKEPTCTVLYETKYNPYAVTINLSTLMEALELTRTQLPDLNEKALLPWQESISSTELKKLKAITMYPTLKNDINYCEADKPDDICLVVTSQEKWDKFDLFVRNLVNMNDRREQYNILNINPRRSSMRKKGPYSKNYGVTVNKKAFMSVFSLSNDSELPEYNQQAWELWQEGPPKNKRSRDEEIEDTARPSKKARHDQGAVPEGMDVENTPEGMDVENTPELQHPIPNDLAGVPELPWGLEGAFDGLGVPGLPFDLEGDLNSLLDSLGDHGLCSGFNLGNEEDPSTLLSNGAAKQVMPLSPHLGQDYQAL